MFGWLTRRRVSEVEVTWKWIGEDEIYVDTATSAGLASMDTDPCIEILSVKKIF
jgi:hypothetical protein